MTKIFRPFFLIILCLLCGCEHCSEPTKPKLSSPVANAGPDQACNVGNYIFLDVTESVPADGEQIVWYEWTQDENNPAEVSLHSTDESDAIHCVRFVTEGIYKFILRVMSNSETSLTYDERIFSNASEADEVIITVNPRGQFLFEDVILELNVRAALEKPTEDITESDLLSLDTLLTNFHGGIEVLNGIEQCVNLICLYIGYNKITDLSPISGLSKLLKLDLSYNRQLSDLSPIANLVHLQYLNLHSTKIFDISPLANLEQLTYLNLHSSPVTDISVLSNLKNLEELWMRELPDGDLSSLTDLTRLTFLWAPTCNITDLTPLKKLTKMQTLYFDNNQIEDLTPLADMTQLEKAILSYNNISDLTPLENWVSIASLQLYMNPITDILSLVNNPGLGEGDMVLLNGLALNEKSINEYIPALKTRGVVVTW